MRSGFYYAPDPSSQIACTDRRQHRRELRAACTASNTASTTNNVLGVEIVTIEGEIVRVGGKHLDAEGYDLLGVLTGSGRVARRRHRSHRAHPAQAGNTRARCSSASPPTKTAGATVAAIIGAGIIPAGMEMMDKPAIHAAEAFVNVGYPLDVEALLIVELDGPAAEVDHLCAQVTALAQAQGAVSCRMSSGEPERLAFWAGRKAAFPAVGRISPDYFCMDGTIPRRRCRACSRGSKESRNRVRLARGQRIPCRRRQPASADPVRFEPAGRARARRGVRRGHSQACASRWAACSPASTAWAWRSATS